MDRLLEPEGTAVHQGDIAFGHDGPQLGLPQAGLARGEEHGPFDDLAGIARPLGSSTEWAKRPRSRTIAWQRAICVWMRCARLPSFSTAPACPSQGARESVLMQAAKLVRDIEGIDQFVALSRQDAAEVAQLLLADAVLVEVGGGHAHPCQPRDGGSR